MVKLFSMIYEDSIRLVVTLMQLSCVIVQVLLVPYLPWKTAPYYTTQLWSKSQSMKTAVYQCMLLSAIIFSPSKLPVVEPQLVVDVN
jgi:hypothetical protein